MLEEQLETLEVEKQFLLERKRCLEEKLPNCKVSRKGTAEEGKSEETTNEGRSKDAIPESSDREA